MNLLIDTHALIWSVMDTGKLSPAAKAAILDPANSVFVSPVSFWEISLKYSLGRLDLKRIAPEDFPRLSLDMDFEVLDLTSEILASSHKLRKCGNADPFDRLIAWHAIKSGLIMISCDKFFDSYAKENLKRLW
jgi:Uncharacterized protein conserved in bacteria